jgi:hypothetical protein
MTPGHQRLSPPELRVALLALVALATGCIVALLLVWMAGLSPEGLWRGARWTPVPAADPEATPPPGDQGPVEAAAARLAARISRPTFARVFLTNLTIMIIFAFALPMLSYWATRRELNRQRHGPVLRWCLLILPIAGMMIQLSRGAFILTSAWLSHRPFSRNLFIYGGLEVGALIVLVALPYAYFRLHVLKALTEGSARLSPSYPEFMWQFRLKAGLSVGAVALAALVETVVPRW